MTSRPIAPSRSQTARRIALILGAIAAVYSAGNALKAAGPLKRARPPKFSQSVTDVFFPDAREQLVGARPETKPLAAKAADGEAGPSNSLPSGAVGAGPLPGWSKLISAEVVEDEIKSQQIALGASLRNSATFKAGDFRKSRMHFSVLAAMFAIDAQYDQALRWQREAPAMRDSLARGGFLCKSGTDDAYRQALARSEELESLVRGGSTASQSAKTEAEWVKIAERGPLMKRMELAQQQVLSATGNSADFARSTDKLSHEAQLIAALADVIASEGYEYSDDETYREYAQAMRTGALDMRAAVEKKDYEQARTAVISIGKACGNCHDGFRN